MLKDSRHFWIVGCAWYLTTAVVSSAVGVQQATLSTTPITASTVSSVIIRTTAGSSSTTTTATTSTTTPLSQTDVIASRAPHVIGVVTAEIYKRVTPDCSVDACSDTALSVDLARSLIHCAAMCSRSQTCVYYRTSEYNATPDPRDKLCYLYGLPPTVTQNSYKFLGQV